jgi:hypothetical protein
MIPFTCVTGLLTYAWPFAKSEAALLGVTVVYGYVNPNAIGCYDPTRSLDSVLVLMYLSCPTR